MNETDDVKGRSSLASPGNSFGRTIICASQGISQGDQRGQAWG